MSEYPFRSRGGAYDVFNSNLRLSSIETHRQVDKSEASDDRYMYDVLAITLSSMQQDMARLDRVALNLANVTTPGYKREVAAVRSFAGFLEASPSSGNAEAQSASGTSMRATNLGMLSVFNDMRPGTLKMTGQVLDVALEGDGFFEIETNGGPAYTRHGQFRLDARGRLVTQRGDPVMGQSGEIYLSTQTSVIDAAGNIREPDSVSGPAAGMTGNSVARLKIVKFDDSRTLKRLGDGLMAAGAGAKVAGDGEVSLRQGALENANVNSTSEMVQLMETMRHFESMQKVAQGYDEMLGTAIHKIGDL